MPVKLKISRKQLIIIIAAALSLIAIIAVIVGVAIGSKEIEYYDFQKDVATGIDVSEHNGEIDWQKVSESVDFAFIRVGYRGYGTGSLNEDIYAAENLKGAKKADIPFGVYFYSQAISAEEAEEEAQMVLKLIARYKPQLPVVIDFEYPTNEDGLRIGRLYEAGLTSEQNTEIINAFCAVVEDGGYASGVYASSSVLNADIDVSALSEDTAVWVADYNGSVSYGGEYKIWQYTRTGELDGVSSKNVDFNYYYSKKQKGE